MLEKKDAFITGGTGFIGARLANTLQARGYRVTAMGQSSRSVSGLDASVRTVAGDGRLEGNWQKDASRSNLIINLAGASIFSRWSNRRKRLIRESRILTTGHLVEALPSVADGVTLLSASAVGYYGFHGDEELSEDSPPGEDFLSSLCRDWEAEAEKAQGKGCRVIIARFGIVLARGGALGRMIPIFRLGLGGPIGSGRQWFSWIHMDDLLAALVYLAEAPASSGVYNLTAPEPVRNSDLTRSLARRLHRPAFLPAPAALVRLAAGEFGDMILQGQRVLPTRLMAEGFAFSHTSIDDALAAVLKTDV